MTAVLTQVPPFAAASTNPQESDPMTAATPTTSTTIPENTKTVLHTHNAPSNNHSGGTSFTRDFKDGDINIAVPSSSVSQVIWTLVEKPRPTGLSHIRIVLTDGNNNKHRFDSLTGLTPDRNFARTRKNGTPFLNSKGMPITFGESLAAAAFGDLAKVYRTAQEHSTVLTALDMIDLLNAERRKQIANLAAKGTPLTDEQQGLFLFEPAPEGESVRTTYINPDDLL